MADVDDDFVGEDEDLSFLEAESKSILKKIEQKPVAAKAAAASSSAAAVDGDEDDDDIMDFGVVDVAKDQFMAIKPWLGAIVAPSNYKKAADADDVPERSLSIDYVYGYRAHDTRDNLFVNTNGHLVYHTAALGVVFDAKNNKQMHFGGHDDDIVSLARSRDGKHIATGQVGKTPPLIVWDSTTCKEVGRFQGFLQRAVVALDFSPDGKYIAAVGLDDDHSVAIYDIFERKMVATAKGDGGKVLVIKWDPLNEGQLVTCGVKHVKFWTLKGNALTAKKGLFGPKGEVTTSTCVAFTEDGSVLTATASGNIYVWNQGAVTEVISKAHKGPAFSVCVREDGSFLSGGSDGRLVLFNAAKKPVATHDFGAGIRSISVHPREEDVVLVGTEKSEIYQVRASAATATIGKVLISQAHYGELWGAALHPLKWGLSASTCDDGTLRLWDSEKRKCVQNFAIGGPSRTCDFHPEGKVIAVGFMNGTVGIVDISTGATVWSDSIRKKEISIVRFSPDGLTLCAGSHDNSLIDLYTVAPGGCSASLKATCRGHHSWITHVDFSQDGKVLQSNSGDYELLFWDTNNGKQITSASSVKDTIWATWTCTLGHPVQGIWPIAGDGTDVNSVCRSQDGSCLVAGEDSRLVRLYKYPCIGSGFDKRGKLTKRPNSKDYKGHSEHVTNVVFTHDDNFVISTGGADRTVIQWSISPAPAKGSVTAAKAFAASSSAVSSSAPPVSASLAAGHAAASKASASKSAAEFPVQSAAVFYQGPNEQAKLFAALQQQQGERGGSSSEGKKPASRPSSAAPARPLSALKQRPQSAAGSSSSVPPRPASAAKSRPVAPVLQHKPIVVGNVNAQYKVSTVCTKKVISRPAAPPPPPPVIARSTPTTATFSSRSSATTERTPRSAR